MTDLIRTELNRTELTPPIQYRDLSGEGGALSTLGDAIHFVRGRAEDEAHGRDRPAGQNSAAGGIGESWETVWSALERAQDASSHELLAVGRDGLIRKLAAEGMLVFSPPPPARPRMIR